MAKAVLQVVFRGRLVRLEGDAMTLRSIDQRSALSAIEELAEKNGRIPNIVRVSHGPS